jgi:lysine 2,3-aminomutase
LNQPATWSPAAQALWLRQRIAALFGQEYDETLWADWRWQMRHRLQRLEQFEQLLELSPKERTGMARAGQRFAVAVTPHFAALMDPRDPSCPIRRQVIPREEELVTAPGDMLDPCGEETHEVVPGLIHPYPDRVLLLATDVCAAYCRYCTRSRLVSQGDLEALPPRLAPILEYLR